MKVFFDCEFTGIRQDTTLVSIGMVSERGDQFYAELNDFNASLVDYWVKTNVLSRLWWNQKPRVEAPPHIVYLNTDKEKVGDALVAWLRGLGSLDHIQLWGDVPAFDTVLLLDLIKPNGFLHAGISYIVRDLATLLEVKGIDADISRMEFSGMAAPGAQITQTHNALYDANLIAKCYERAMSL